MPEGETRCLSRSTMKELSVLPNLQSSIRNHSNERRNLGHEYYFDMIARKVREESHTAKLCVSFVLPSLTYMKAS